METLIKTSGNVLKLLALSRYAKVVKANQVEKTHVQQEGAVCFHSFYLENSIMLQRFAQWGLLFHVLVE